MVANEANLIKTICKTQCSEPILRTAMCTVHAQLYESKKVHSFSLAIPSGQIAPFKRKCVDVVYHAWESIACCECYRQIDEFTKEMRMIDLRFNRINII